MSLVKLVAAILFVATVIAQSSALTVSNAKSVLFARGGSSDLVGLAPQSPVSTVEASAAFSDEDEAEIAYEEPTNTTKPLPVNVIAARLAELLTESDELRKALTEERQRSAPSTRAPHPLVKARKFAGNVFKNLGSAVAASAIIAFHTDAISQLAIAIAVASGILLS